MEEIIVRKEEVEVGVLFLGDHLKDSCGMLQKESRKSAGSCGRPRERKAERSKPYKVETIPAGSSIESTIQLLYGTHEDLAMERIVCKE